MKKNKLGFIIKQLITLCLVAVLFCPNFSLIGANAEYEDCWYDHDHVEAKGYSTGETYYVEEGFGSDVVYEAVKLVEGEEYIEVDGFKDDVWDSAYEIESFVVTEKAENNRNTRIVASYMWDDENLYVWAEIYDSTYTLSWDNGKDWAAWGDYCELYVDTLHNSSLAEDGWDGTDGPDYRGKNPNSGTWPDGSEYEDCCFGQFKISAGFNQTLDRTDPDTKYGRGGAVQWQQWTWLSAACWEDDVSLFTSAFIYEDRDLSEPYDRYKTNGGIQNGAELALGKPIGYTFEAQINFKSSDYMPEDGSIIGAGLRIADMTDISWWADMGGDYCIYAQESQAGSMWERPKNLPHLALLPADGESSSGGEEKQYTANFVVDEQVVHSVTGPKKTEVNAPADPVKPGYTFIGWKGYSEGYTLRGNKTFVAEFERTMNELPVWPNEVQATYNFTELPDGYTVNIYQGEKTTATIEVDGVMDEAYREATAIEIVELNEGNSDTTGFAYVIWDDEYIYLYVVVYDTYVSNTKDAAQPWLSDSVEFYLDTYNDPNGQKQNYGDGYRGEDYVGEGQFRLNAGEKTLSGMHWMYDNSDVNKKAASRIIDGEGYTAEYKIEWGSFKKDADIGEQIAFAVVINDGEGSNRNGQIALEPEQNHAFEWAGVLSKLELVDESETIAPPVVEPTQPSSGSSSNGGRNCKSSLLATTPIVTLSVAFVVIFLSKKKRG